MKDGRQKNCKQELLTAWLNSTKDEQRIPVLKKIIKKYPEFMEPLSELASALLSVNNIEKAKHIYQQLIDRQSQFKDLSLFILGKAYLMLDQIDKAIECFVSDNCIDEDKNVFLAFSFLKIGDKEKATSLFDKWISEYVERAFKLYSYRKYIEPIFGNHSNNVITESWANYHRTYSEMPPYDLYCLIYDQRKKYNESHPEEDLSECSLQPKLSRSEFIRLSLEYLDIDRQYIYKEELTDDELKRMEELRDLIFADIIF